MAVLLRRHHRLVGLTGNVLLTDPLLRHDGIYYNFLLDLARHLLPMPFQQIIRFPAPLSALGRLGLYADDIF